MKWKILLLFCALSQLAKSQGKENNEQFYVFDKKWKPVDVKKAVYFLRARKLNDSSWEWVYYNMYGPRIKVENYKDAKATIKNGKFVYYFQKGTIDSSGNYVDGQLDGEWYYKNIEGQVVRKKTYHKGALVSDSLLAPSNTGKSKGNELKAGELESEYPGGLPAWSRFLTSNLHYPDRAINNEVQGEVRVQFIVDLNGDAIDAEINKSVEYALDEEALRIIRISGKWAAAMLDNKKVKSYKIQPIIFKLSVN
ncbi:MAG: energy transducer TonB [Bacteroidetes bacterium]|nr:energy transducer TonB [Bacteroidota bacterium]MBS1972952.1 energy transducer TonB [Bacteroidota bacterium]